MKHPVPVVVGDGAAHAAAQQLQRLRLAENEGKECVPVAQSPPDTPGAPTGLPQGMQRIASLVEVKGWKSQQIETRLHQLRVTDYDLDTGLQLAVVPILTLVGRNRRAQDRYANASLSQNGLEPQRDVFLSRERGVDLAAA